MNVALGRVKALLMLQVTPPVPEKFKRKLKGVLRWGLWSLLALFILGVITWTALNIVGSRRLDAALASLRQSGYATRLSDLAPPEVRREDNAAPFYSAAFELFVQPGRGKEYEAYQRAYMAGLEDLPLEQKERLRTWLEENAECFELASRAISRDRCRFAREYAGFHTAIPEASKVLWLSNALSLRAQFLAREGKLESARGCVSQIYRLADALKEEPLVLCQVVRHVAIRTALEGIQGCVTVETDAEALHRWIEMLPREGDFEGSMERPLRGELAAIVESLPLTTNKIRAWAGRPREDDFCLANSLLDLLLYPLQKCDGARISGFLRRAIEISRKTYLESEAEWWALQDEAREGTELLLWDSRAVVSGLSSMLESQARVQAQIAVTRAGLEWELERRTNGRYPDKMPTIDPFTGQPLLYALAEGWIRSAGPSRHRGPRREDPVWRLRPPP